jgi:hypothetical protein
MPVLWKPLSGAGISVSHRPGSAAPNAHEVTRQAPKSQYCRDRCHFQFPRDLSQDCLRTAAVSDLHDFGLFFP